MIHGPLVAMSPTLGPISTYKLLGPFYHPKEVISLHACGAGIRGWRHRVEQGNKWWLFPGMKSLLTS